MKQKREKLMRALSYADDEYITEAAPVHVKPSKRRFLKSLTALAASLFHFKEMEIKDLKEYLDKRGVPVRL